LATDSREQAALDAYCKLMQGKGADEANLAQRCALLTQLLPRLTAQPAEGWLYRDIVDDVLPLIEREQWPFFLLLTREYFPFWTSDIKAIATLNADGGFVVDPPPQAQTEESLKQVWKRLDTEKFSVAETWPLKAYLAALREEGADKLVVDTRQKLVKLLLVQLRDITEKNGKHYRTAVESTLPLFVMKETRNLFLVVVREFFYFWMGDPDAATHIVLDLV
jgi:hypothetical protein